LSSRSGRPILTFLTSSVSHGTARFLRAAKYHVYFADNSLLFSEWKNFQNRLTIDKFMAKSSTPHLFWNTVQLLARTIRLLLLLTNFVVSWKLTRYSMLWSLYSCYLTLTKPHDIPLFLIFTLLSVQRRHQTDKKVLNNTNLMLDNTWI